MNIGRLIRRLVGVQASIDVIRVLLLDVVRHIVRDPTDILHLLRLLLALHLIEKQDLPLDLQLVQKHLLLLQVLELLERDFMLSQSLWLLYLYVWD